MVTLPILASVLLAICILGAIVTAEDNPYVALRRLMHSVLYIVTVWLCFAGPGETAPLVCAIIVTAWSAISLVASVLNGGMKKAMSDQGTGNVLFLFLLTTGLLQTALWVPWTFG